MSIADLESKLEATRQSLDRTLEALANKLSPSRRLKAAWGAAQARSSGAALAGRDWVLENPVPVLAIGVSLVLALLLRHRIASLSQRALRGPRLRRN